MFTRSELCVLSNINDGRLKAMSRMEQLPFETPARDDAGWRRYSADDVLRLALLEHFIRDDGFLIDPASKAVYNAYGTISDLPTDTSEDVWLGLVRHSEGETAAGITHVGGTLAQVAMKMRASEEQRLRQEDGAAPYRLALVNASQVKRRIRQRAEAFDQQQWSEGHRSDLLDRVDRELTANTPA